MSEENAKILDAMAKLGSTDSRIEIANTLPVILSSELACKKELSLIKVEGKQGYLFDNGEAAH